MAWNICILTTEASFERADEIIPDIFFKSRENLHFDEAISREIDNGLSVGYAGGQMIIIDVLGRFIHDDNFPKFVSTANAECKVFWVSEGLIYRNYKSGECVQEIIGVAQAEDKLREVGMTPIDEWGETMILQLLDYEVFGTRRMDHNSPMWEVAFDLYELD